MTDTISRRTLLAGSGAGLFTLNANRLGAAHLAPWQHPTAVTGEFEAQDWATGHAMWDGGYSDMPYMTAMPDGSIVSTLTVSDSIEGAHTQHVIILRSVDRGETWVTIAEMESASAPESSWGMPWLTAGGRLYVFYEYNVNDVRSIPYTGGGGSMTRVDMMGVIAYKSSPDGGQSWSGRQHLTLPVTAIDLRNPFAGAHQLHWMSGHPVTRDGAAYLGVSKAGQIMLNQTILPDTEPYVLKIWETSPGMLASALSAPIVCGQPVAEEPSPIVFDDGIINVAFRTFTGRLGEAWSADDGATWIVGWAQAQTGGSVPQPRAKAAQFLLPDGRVLLWGHNTVGADGTWGPRNPIFYRIGERSGPHIMWGPPRLLLWEREPTIGVSYPSLLVDGDDVLIAATDKMAAKTFRFPMP